MNTFVFKSTFSVSPRSGYPFVYQGNDLLIENFLKLSNDATDLVTGIMYEEHTNEQATITDVIVLPRDTSSKVLNTLIDMRIVNRLTAEVCMSIFANKSIEPLCPAIYPALLDAMMPNKEFIINAYKERLKLPEIKRLVEQWNMVVGGHKDMLRLGK
jgi:hypothetical protein